MCRDVPASVTLQSRQHCRALQSAEKWWLDIRGKKRLFGGKNPDITCSPVALQPTSQPRFQFYCIPGRALNVGGDFSTCFYSLSQGPVRPERHGAPAARGQTRLDDRTSSILLQDQAGTCLENKAGRGGDYDRHSEEGRGMRNGLNGALGERWRSDIS